MRIAIYFLLVMCSIVVYADCSTYEFDKHIVARVKKYPTEKLKICDDGTYTYLSPRYGGDGNWNYIDPNHVIGFNGPLYHWGPGVKLEESKLEFDYNNRRGDSVYSVMYVPGARRCNPWPFCF